ncbi:hypothetical protein Tco_1400485 [Tanacetum coccineum]
MINSQISSKDKTGLGYGDQLNENNSSSSELFNSVFDNLSSDGDDNQTKDMFKKDNGYHVVPPPLTGNYMPPFADLSFAGLDDSIYRSITNNTSASVSQVETSITPLSNTSVEMPRVESVRPCGVIIKDWVSDDDEDIFQSNDSQTTVKPSFKKIKFTKARNEPVKSDKQAVKPRMVTQSSKVDRKDWNGKMTQKLGLGFGFTKKACFVIGSHNHLIKDCDFHEKRMSKKYVLNDKGKETDHREVRPIWNNTQRINHQNKFVPTAVLTRSGRIPVSTAKHTTTAGTSANGEVELTATIDGQLNKQRRLLQPHTRTYPTPILTQKVFSNMKRVSRGYSGIDFSLFPTMISAPETSPSRITSSPSLSPQHTPVSTPSTSQPPNTQPTPDAEEAVPMPHESPLHSVHSLGRDEGSLSLSELTVLCTNLSNKVTSLEAELAQTKQTYGTALTKLIKKVKKLEQTVKSTQARRRFRIVVSDDEEGLEDPSKQGRKITEIDQDPSISLVQDEGTSWIQEDIEIQEKISDDTEVVLEEEEPTELVEDQGSGEKGEKEVSTVGAEHSTVIPEVSTAAANLSKKDLGMKKLLDCKNRLMKRKDKIARDAEIAKPLQEEINKATQEQEKQEVLTEADPTHVIDWSDPAVIRYHALQNRAFSVPKDQIHSFVPMDSELEILKLKRVEPVKRQSTKEEKKRDDSSKPAEGRRKKTLARKRASGKDSEESMKKQKLEDDIEKEDLKAYLDIIPGDDVAIDIESLATKYPIVDWKTYVLAENFMYYQIFRADGSSKNYKIFSEMLDDFDR